MKQTPVRLREVFSVTKNAKHAVMEGVAVRLGVRVGVRLPVELPLDVVVAEPVPLGVCELARVLAAVWVADGVGGSHTRP